MTKKHKLVALSVFLSLLVLIIVGLIFVPAPAHHAAIGEVMKDGVLHENDHINLFGLCEVNPGLVSALCVSGILIVFAVLVRLLVIPRFTDKPGKFQLLLEEAVGLFDRLAKSNSAHRPTFIGGYIFTAGAYIFVSTVFELFGLQAVGVSGASLTLPAPLSDINGAIAMGFLSYGVILFGGLILGGFGGMFKALKDFSLPISMSFRLFGALLSGALVTELVYHYAALSYGLPVLVGVLFTLIHAVVQTYVLTMLTALFYGESTEPKHHK